MIQMIDELLVPMRPRTKEGKFKKIYAKVTAPGGTISLYNQKDMKVVDFGNYETHIQKYIRDHVTEVVDRIKYSLGDPPVLTYTNSDSTTTFTYPITNIPWSTTSIPVGNSTSFVCSSDSNVQISYTGIAQ